MTIYRALRKHMGLTQGRIAELCGLHRNVWMRIESGQTLPSPEAVLRIQAVVERGALPHQGQELSPEEIRRWSTGARYALPIVHGEPWRRAARNFWHKSRFPVNEARRLWMETFLPAGSSLECRVLLELAHAGARPQLSSPTDLGLRDLPILDALGFALGERCLPGLQGQLPTLEFLLWPQVHLRPEHVTYCVDALVRLRKGRKSGWALLEVDGKGHNSANDVYRADSLKLKFIRLDHETIVAGQALPSFVEQARRCLG